MGDHTNARVTFRRAIERGKPAVAAITARELGGSTERLSCLAARVGEPLNDRCLAGDHALRPPRRVDR